MSDKDQSRKSFRRAGRNPNVLGRAKEFSPERVEDVQDNQNLNQISHRETDVDSGPLSLHHTLGWGAGQAAPGAKSFEFFSRVHRGPFVQLIRSTVGIPGSKITFDKELREYKLLKVTVVGDGGGSGGTAATGGSEVAEAGGGGAGGVAIGWDTIPNLLRDYPAGIPVSGSIGTGGSGGSAGNNNGSAGSTWEFGDNSGGKRVRATGGGGGSGAAATSTTGTGDSGSAGSGTHGDLLFSGGSGGTGRAISGSLVRLNWGGGNSFAGITLGNGSSLNGINGKDWGGGASGARNGFSQSARPGGDGGGGGIILEWYY